MPLGQGLSLYSQSALWKVTGSFLVRCNNSQGRMRAVSGAVQGFAKRS